MKTSSPTVFETLDQLVKTSGDFLLEAPWENKDFYAAWLAQASYYIRHSTRLLALAGSRIPIDDNPMHHRFMSHCAEEKGHENLPIMDIKNIDRDFKDYAESPSTQAFYQNQYYWIEHVDPLAFFGYILFLESLACDYGPKLTEMIEKIHGPKSVHFLRVHSDADVEHVRDALERVHKLPQAQKETIQKNLEFSAAMYRQLCAEALRQSGAPVRSAA